MHDYVFMLHTYMSVCAFMYVCRYICTSLYMYGWMDTGRHVHMYACVTEWISLQIKHINLYYYFLFNSFYNKVIWN